MTKSTYEFSVFCIVTGTIIIFLFGILVKMICEISHERALEPTYYSHRDATYCTKVEKSRLTYYEAMTYGGSCCRDEKITIYDRSGRKCVITLKDNNKKIKEIHRNWVGTDKFHNR